MTTIGHLPIPPSGLSASSFQVSKLDLDGPQVSRLRLLVCHLCERRSFPRQYCDMFSSALLRRIACFRFHFVLIAIVLVLPRAAKADANDVASSMATDFLRSNCIDCHDGPSGEGGFDVASLSSDLNDSQTFERWVRVFDRVHDGEMPPEEAGELDSDDVAAFVLGTSDWLKTNQQNQYDARGRVQGRRLTNLQLERTLHDLLGIDVPLAKLMTEEPRVEGFVGIADHQAMSHFQLQSHLTVVDAALDAAMRRVAMPNQPWTRSYAAVDIARANANRRCRDPEMLDGVAVTWSSKLIFYGRITSTTMKEDGWYRFRFKASAVNKPDDHGVWCTVRSGFCSSGAPLLSWIGSFEAGDQPTEHVLDAWIPKGNMIEIRPGDGTIKLAKFAGGQVGAGEGTPQKVPGVALHEMSIERIHPGGDLATARKRVFGELNVSVEPKSGKFKLDSDDTIEDLSKQVRRFAKRAFRSPVSATELEPYLGWMRQAIAEGDDPITALRAAYRAILCSPRFLYLVEPVGPLDNHAIASRLSYMLTGSMPDWRLTKLAHEQKLRDPIVLEQEVDRLLAGQRSHQFVRDFSDQWLDMSKIEFTEPDGRLYGDFDIVVQHAMLHETHHYLHHLIQNDRPADELIQSDYTFVNSRLARYYGLDANVGDETQRVDLPSDSPRGGLLAQGSILKVTADGTNTSPVLRGVWVSERILGTEIPPPPQNVPAVEPDIRGAKTIREQLQKHLSDSSCNACHRNIDPPGYALENFDAAGQWRDRYLQKDKGKLQRGAAVDSSFVMADGRRFETFKEFRHLVCDDIRPVARNVAAHLLVYGTGAPIGFADREDLDAIVDRTANSSYGLRSVLKAVVTSEPFLNK